MFLTDRIPRSICPCTECTADDRCSKHQSLSQYITSLPGYPNDRPIRRNRLSDILILPVIIALILSPALPDQTRERFHPSVKRRAAIRKMAAGPSFLCTFCWVPQYPPSRPKVLGKEARIACVACWKGVLDLSICWVCGEIIVHGEDVVSLGWLFMHSRTCFCCLFCGMNLDLDQFAPEVKSDTRLDEHDEIKPSDSPQVNGAIPVYDREQGSSGRSNQETIRSGEELIKKFYIPLKNRRHRRGAIELETVPICDDCGHEDTGDKNRWDRLWSSMQVAKVDGGLSDSRWQMLRDEREAAEDWADQPGKRYLKTLAKKERQAEKMSKKHLTIHELPEELARSPPNNATRTALDRDGDASLSHPSSPAHPIAIKFRTSQVLPNPVYVNILSPIAEPSFRPHSTKPIPSWMQAFPSDASREHLSLSAPATTLSIDLNSFIEGPDTSGSPTLEPRPTPDLTQPPKSQSTSLSLPTEFGSKLPTSAPLLRQRPVSIRTGTGTSIYFTPPDQFQRNTEFPFPTDVMPRECGSGHVPEQHSRVNETSISRTAKGKIARAQNLRASSSDSTTAVYNFPLSHDRASHYDSRQASNPSFEGPRRDRAPGQPPESPQSGRSNQQQPDCNGLVSPKASPISIWRGPSTALSHVDLAATLNMANKSSEFLNLYRPQPAQVTSNYRRRESMNMVEWLRRRRSAARKGEQESKGLEKQEGAGADERGERRRDSKSLFTGKA
ncbi:MAG: hypothetical protein M1818_004618 [Claussenomyces sp. TS43310]|nr:MAG: hypothetical protein M1818_004618 [Claussenomyces sp. TS43310]